jgi:putative hydrolase
MTPSRPDTTGLPVAALRRIAFLLERQRASTYRVRAYRTAALAVAALPASQVAQRAAAGTLTELAGVGPKTATVIRQALDGVPAYLEELESAVVALVDGGAALRAELRGDLHMHSDWSDGGSPIEEMAVTAIELGHEYAVLTDHSPRLKVARGLSAQRLARQLEVLDGLAGRLGPFRLLRGIEVDILDDGSLDQTPDLLDRLDVVVASVHSKLRMERAEMTARMLTAIANPHVNVLGHCTGRLVEGGRGTRPPSQFDTAAVFAACARHGVAVEINSRPERQDPPEQLIAQAIEAGCLFSIDTDAHAPGQLDWQWYGCARAEATGVPAERIVNTWPVHRLLEWSERAR